MSAKHTPGPWGVRKGFSSGTYEIYPKRPGEKVSFRGARWAEIATVEGASKGESARANANLMAAAPDMLEALESITLAMNKMSDDTDVFTLLQEIKAAQYAISKAKGGAA